MYKRKENSSSKVAEKPPEEWKIEGVEPDDVPKSHRRTHPKKQKSSSAKKPEKPNYNQIIKKKNHTTSGNPKEPNYNAIKYHNRKHWPVVQQTNSHDIQKS